MPFLIPALFMLLAPPVSASTELHIDTVHLYQSCRAVVRSQEYLTSAPDAITADYCLGYMRGYFAGIDLYADNGAVCASQVTFGTAARVYAAYMDRNPRLFDHPPEVGFFGAMFESFPCDIKKNR